MISLTRLIGLRKQFLNSLRHMFPQQEDVDLSRLASYLVNCVRKSITDRDGDLVCDDTPEIDIDANPLDGDLPANDRGEWLDHSPDVDETPPLNQKL